MGRTSSSGCTMSSTAKGCLVKDKGIPGSTCVCSGSQVYVSAQLGFGSGDLRFPQPPSPLRVTVRGPCREQGLLLATHLYICPPSLPPSPASPSPHGRLIWRIPLPAYQHHLRQPLRRVRSVFFMLQVALVTHIRRSSLEAVFDSTTRRAQQYEVQMKDLEAKLAEDLSNSRAIETYLREVVQGLEVRATPVRRSSPLPTHRRPPYPYLRSAAHHTPFQVCAVNCSTANQA